MSISFSIEKIKTSCQQGLSELSIERSRLNHDAPQQHKHIPVSKHAVRRDIIFATKSKTHRHAFNLKNSDQSIQETILQAVKPSLI
tara:strand:- start:45259 stop:45516 length:258 start_codon:yes stop_codon:yes gene_type:complete